MQRQLGLAKGCAGPISSLPMVQIRPRRVDAPVPHSRCPSAGSAVQRGGPWGRSSERPAGRAGPSAAARAPARARGRRCMRAYSRHWPGRSVAAAAADDRWGPAAAAGAAAAGAAREAAVTAAHSAAVAAAAAAGAAREAEGAVAHSVAAAVAVAQLVAAAAAAGELAKGGWAPALDETHQVSAHADCAPHERTTSFYNGAP